MRFSNKEISKNLKLRKPNFNRTNQLLNFKMNQKSISFYKFQKFPSFKQFLKVHSQKQTLKKRITMNKIENPKSRLKLLWTRLQNSLLSLNYRPTGNLKVLMKRN